MNAAALPLSGGLRWAWVLAAAGLACVLLGASVSAHLRLSCTVRDTPYLPLCPQPDPAESAQLDLRDRIARNPGDSWGWVRLLVRDGAKDGPLLHGAAVLAPHHASVLRRRAVEALQGGRLEEGVALLIQLLQHRHNPDAARLVAQLAAAPEGVALLRPHLPEAARWLPSALAALQPQNIPPPHALPLVVEALQQRVLPEEARRAYMRSLKAGGFWLDAYGLWLAQHGDTVPLLYNGGFDAPFQPDGFDWEYTPVIRSRAGVLLDQHPLARRGQVLDMEFTGRSFAAPVLRQYVFTPPGHYRLRVDYMASKLRSEGGLAWNVVCVATRRNAPMRREAIQDTGGLWKSMVVEFTIPPDCGPVASLQLEPAAAFEAAAGIKGRVAIDALGLTRSAGHPL